MIEEARNQQQPINTEKQQAKKENKEKEEFSLKWHIKVLTIIYIILFIFYIILKLTLK